MSEIYGTLPPDMPRVRDTNYKEVYSNASMTQLGPFDISLMFQKLAEIMPGHMGLIDQVLVTFSPQQFKALVKSLNETLNGYEAAFGELKIPDSDIAPRRSAEDIKGQIDKARAASRLTSSTEKPQPSTRSRGAAQKKGS